MGLLQLFILYRRKSQMLTLLCQDSSRHDKIKLVNQKLRKWCQSGKVKNVHYLKPDKDWTKPDGQLVERYYFTDFLHLVEEGYEKFAKSIYEAIVKVSQGNVAKTVYYPNPNQL